MSATCSRKPSRPSSSQATGAINWRYLPASNEVIWFSERDNWGQLYLYDLQTGKLKRQITSGEGNVTQLLRVDEKRRLLFLLAVGREKSHDPYFTHLYKVNMDGGIPALLTPEDATHEVFLPDAGDYFVDSYSAPDRAPVAVVRDVNGKLILTLEKADISRLMATGWRPPTPFTVKARDGETDLYGLMFKPSALDQTKKYPIINQIYPGPQTGSVGGRTFAAARGATPRHSPSSGSSSSRSTGWERRGARRSFTRRTSGTWATTRCRTRSPG